LRSLHEIRELTRLRERPRCRLSCEIETRARVAVVAQNAGATEHWKTAAHGRRAEKRSEDFSNRELIRVMRQRTHQLDRVAGISMSLRRCYGGLLQTIDGFRRSDGVGARNSAQTRRRIGRLEQTLCDGKSEMIRQRRGGRRTA
jgi:hypothetical protein